MTTIDLLQKKRSPTAEIIVGGDRLFSSIEIISFSLTVASACCQESPLQNQLRLRSDRYASFQVLTVTEFSVIMLAKRNP